jgi:hypothetical protein
VSLQGCLAAQRQTTVKRCAAVMNVLTCILNKSIECQGRLRFFTRFFSPDFEHGPIVALYQTAAVTVLLQTAVSAIVTGWPRSLTVASASKICRNPPG